MEFGLQFFPSVGNEITAEAYFEDALNLCTVGEDLALGGGTTTMTATPQTMPTQG